jgi:hypothetical protein
VLGEFMIFRIKKEELTVVNSKLLMTRSSEGNKSLLCLACAGEQESGQYQDGAKHDARR